MLFPQQPVIPSSSGPLKRKAEQYTHSGRGGAGNSHKRAKLSTPQSPQRPYTPSLTEESAASFTTGSIRSSTPTSQNGLLRKCLKRYTGGTIAHHGRGGAGNKHYHKPSLHLLSIGEYPIHSSDTFSMAPSEDGTYVTHTGNLDNKTTTVVSEGTYVTHTGNIDESSTAFYGGNHSFSGITTIGGYYEPERKTKRKPAPVPLFSPQNEYNMNFGPDSPYYPDDLNNPIQAEALHSNPPGHQTSMSGVQSWLHDSVLNEFPSSSNPTASAAPSKDASPTASTFSQPPPYDEIDAIRPVNATVGNSSAATAPKVHPPDVNPAHLTHQRTHSSGRGGAGNFIRSQPTPLSSQRFDPEESPRSVSSIYLSTQRRSTGIGGVGNFRPQPSNMHYENVESQARPQPRKISTGIGGAGNWASSKEDVRRNDEKELTARVDRLKMEPSRRISTGIGGAGNWVKKDTGNVKADEGGKEGLVRGLVRKASQVFRGKKESKD